MKSEESQRNSGSTETLDIAECSKAQVILSHADAGAKQEPKSVSPAVDRAARILDLLAESDAPLGLADLSRALQAPKSSLHGLCSTLTRLRLISRSENGLMSIGPHVMFWANAFLSKANIAQEFSSVCREAGIMTDETITLSVLDGAHVVYIACHNGSRPLGIQFLIGMRLPAQFTATGKPCWPQWQTMRWKKDCSVHGQRK